MTKSKGGRPSKYEQIGPETVCKQARKLCERLGATDADLADFFEVCEATISNWKNDHPEFLEAIKAGKNASDAVVVRRLFERATGYSHEEDKIFQYEGAPVVVPTVKHYAPDTTAAIFWLKNRQPEQWRDKQEHEHTGKDGTPLVAALNVTIGSGSEPPPEAGNGS